MLCAHAFAALMVIGSPLTTLLRLALVIVLIVSLIYYWRRNRQRVRIEISVDNFCLLQIDGAVPIECSISPRSFVASYLVILRLEREQCRAKYIVITPDQLDADEFRRLRVFLRWGLSFGERGTGVKI